MSSFSNELPSKRSKGKGKSGSAKKKELVGYAQTYNDESNELFGKPQPLQPKTELMSIENKHMPILSGNKGLPKIYGISNKLKMAGYYKPQIKY
jgi:hypothetical protein